MTNECLACGLSPEQPGNPSGYETCGQCGKGIWVPAPSKIGKAVPTEVTMLDMIERVHTLEGELFTARSKLDAAKKEIAEFKPRHGEESLAHAFRLERNAARAERDEALSRLDAETSLRKDVQEHRDHVAAKLLEAQGRLSEILNRARTANPNDYAEDLYAIEQLAAGVVEIPAQFGECDRCGRVELPHDCARIGELPSYIR